MNYINEMQNWKQYGQDDAADNLSILGDEFDEWQGPASERWQDIQDNAQDMPEYEEWNSEDWDEAKEWFVAGWLEYVNERKAEDAASEATRRMRKRELHHMTNEQNVITKSQVRRVEDTFLFIFIYSQSERRAIQTADNMTLDNAKALAQGMVGGSISIFARTNTLPWLSDVVAEYTTPENVDWPNAAPEDDAPATVFGGNTNERAG